MVTNTSEPSESSTSSTTISPDFHNPQIPSTDGLIQSVKSILENFDKCSNDDIKSDNIRKHIIATSEQAKKFRLFTIESIQSCDLMGNYASDFAEYITILMEENVAGVDFVGVMKSQIESATISKSNAERLATNYCDILATLKNLLNELEGFPSKIQIEENLEQDIEESKKEQAIRTWSAVGTGIATGAAIIAAPFTGGASLAIIGTLGLTSAGAMIGTTVTSVQFGEQAKLSENELNQFNQIKRSVRNIISDISIIIDKFSFFYEFFKLELENITKIENNFSYLEKVDIKVSKMKGTALKNQWNRVNQVFSKYSNVLRPLFV
ncbi:2941_t:CDS:2 [Diversispora eburnea]|uniref:2941_t:CDS:1 n=1 Tax=Diversispora eburnea TaxID=1213867 RepID=A0A9N8V3P5_9GLOM|nr:2941_t:CDS:2 [Diversispora eburnea]